MYCIKCGKSIPDGSSFCPSCGAAQGENRTQPIDSQPTTNLNASTIPKKKKRKSGCLIGLLFAIIGLSLIFVIAMIPSSENEDVSNSDSSITTEQWIEFDTKTWNDFATLYKSHNAFMSTMSAFSDGKIDAVTMYTECEKAENVFRNFSIALNYGESEEQKTYVEVLQTMALSDQLCTESLKKYLDSGKTSDLADVQKNIKSATEAVNVFASNRGKLLVKTGLTDAEIAEKIETDTATLDDMDSQ